MSEDRSAPGERSESAGEKTPGRLKSWRGRLLWVAGLAILAAGATVYAVPVMDRLEEQRTEIAESAAELEKLLAENAELQGRLDSLNTPVEIERLARERLGYVRAGETAFVVVSPPAEPAAPEVVGEVAETPGPESDPWYKEWWSYVSGSDLADYS